MEIVEKCIGCLNVIKEKLCNCYEFPEAKWGHTPSGICPRATHVKKEAKEDQKSKDPLKQSKKKAQGKG